MNQCKNCPSYAINPGQFGRGENDDLDLCDVCYWRTRAEGVSEAVADALATLRESFVADARLEAAYERGWNDGIQRGIDTVAALGLPAAKTKEGK